MGVRVTKNRDAGKTAPKPNVFHGSSEQCLQYLEIILSRGGFIKAVNTPNSFQGWPCDSSVPKKIYANVLLRHHPGALAADTFVPSKERFQIVVLC